jgi:hypothetical protein
VGVSPVREYWPSQSVTECVVCVVVGGITHGGRCRFFTFPPRIKTKVPANGTEKKQNRQVIN